MTIDLASAATADLHAAPLRQEDIAGVLALMVAQDARQHTRDGNLRPPRTAEQLAALIEQHRAASAPLVVRVGDEQARGYAWPAVAVYPADSDMLALYAARSGSPAALTLPPPGPEAVAVLEVLLPALEEAWREQDTLGETITWPAADSWLEPALLGHGFRLDSALAYRPSGPLVASRKAEPAGLTARVAVPADAEAIVELHHIELAFHQGLRGFVRLVPAIEPQLRARLARTWAGESVEDGAPLPIVVEAAGEIIALAETSLAKIAAGSLTSRLEPGRYAYLNSVAVREEWRGQGVGRVLIEAVLHAYEPLDVRGSYLYYTPQNPLSSMFWPRLGWQPLLLVYQRRHDGVGQDQP